jgi:hypothetical protein
MPRRHCARQFLPPAERRSRAPANAQAIGRQRRVRWFASDNV